MTDKEILEKQLQKLDKEISGLSETLRIRYSDSVGYVLDCKRVRKRGIEGMILGMVE